MRQRGIDLLPCVRGGGSCRGGNVILDAPVKGLSNGSLAVLVVIVAAGAALRFYHLGAQSLWMDEVVSAEAARQIDSDGFTVVAQKDNASPLSHWLIWLSMKTAGTSDAAVRLPSAVAGVFAIVFVFLLARELSSARAALWAAAFAALSPIALWYAQDARMYSLVFALAAVTLYVFWRAIENPRSPALWAALAAATAASVYTHQYAVLLSAACGLFLLFYGKPRSIFLKWLATQAVAAAAFVPWVILTLHRAGSGAGSAKAGAVMWGPYTFWSFLYGFSLGPSVRELHVSGGVAAVAPYVWMMIPLVLAGAAVFVAGGVRLLWGRTRKAGVLCLVCLAVPLAAATAAAMFTNVSYNVRYVMGAFPAFAVVMGAGLANEKRSKVVFAAGVVLAAGMAFSIVNWYTDGRYAKEDSRSAARFLSAAVAENDMVIISSTPSAQTLGYYGFHRGGAIRVTQKNLKDVAAAVREGDFRGAKHVWLVESRQWESDPRGELRRALERSAVLSDKRTWPGVTVMTYVPRLTMPEAKGPGGRASAGADGVGDRRAPGRRDDGEYHYVRLPVLAFEAATSASAYIRTQRALRSPDA